MRQLLSRTRRARGRKNCRAATRGPSRIDGRQNPVAGSKLYSCLRRCRFGARLICGRGPRRRRYNNGLCRSRCRLHRQQQAARRPAGECSRARPRRRRRGSPGRATVAGDSLRRAATGESGSPRVGPSDNRPSAAKRARAESQRAPCPSSASKRRRRLAAPYATSTFNSLRFRATAI